MTRRSLIMLVAAVLVIGAVTAVLVASVGGGDSNSTHMMPNGQTMQGGGMQTTSTDMTMPNGTTMSTTDMSTTGK